MKVYLNYYYYSFLTILMYPYELLISIIEPLLEIGLLALFWNMVSSASSKQINVSDMIAYFIVVQFISAWSISPSGLSFSGRLSKIIKTGELTQYLIRPLPPLPAIFSWYRGMWTVDMVYTLGLLFLAIYLIGDVTLFRFVLFLIFLILSGIISFSICVLIATISFATTEVRGIRHSISHLIRLLSGSLVPLTFFPEQYQRILKLSPFPSMMFSPINILQNQSALNTMWYDLLIALTWAVLLFYIAIWYWKLGIKKYEAIGI